jgi:hypothetical protein
MTISHKKTYAHLSKEERQHIIECFDCAMEMGAMDAGHACAIAAGRAFGLTERQWNSMIGTNCFATVVTVVFFMGEERIPNPKNTQSRFRNLSHPVTPVFTMEEN